MRAPVTGLRSRTAGWAAACGAALVLTGCANNSSRYVWGGYDSTVYSVTAGLGNDGTEDVETLIQLAERDLERATVSEKLIPPGLHAHLGLLYSLRGDLSLAVAAFEAEMDLYPESRTFLTGVIERMGAGS